MQIARRSVLIGGLGGLASLSAAGRAAATLVADVNTLSFYNLHTAETLKVTYREHGDIVPGTLEAVNHLLRDFRTDEVHTIDVELLDTLSLLYDQFGRRGRFEIISGYRSPQTNEALRQVTTGVAKKSLHLSGRAIDIRSTAAKTTELRAAALKLQRGGVGYYAKSNFVHIDTGAFRAW